LERRFESELKELKSQILAMGGFVEQAIARATDALNSRDVKKLEDVHLLEKRVNEAHIAVDSSCLEILARLSPVAADLRLILAIIKINTDLERMGDQAVNIAYNSEHYLAEPPISLELGLSRMAELVREMVRDSLDAFLKADVELAQQLLERDDEVDAIKNKIFDVLVDVMQKRKANIEPSLDLILIARNLERISDHATNIAEDVIFAYTGEDVRHSVIHNGTQK
jgi:phosphate transport system protein